jgi:hypothetical protein
MDVGRSICFGVCTISLRIWWASNKAHYGCTVEIHLLLSSVASSQSARVMLAKKEAGLQDPAAELEALDLQFRSKK